MIRRIKFDTLVSLRNLLEKQTNKDIRKPLRTAKEVIMLLDAILYDIDSFDHFYNFGRDIDVYLTVDNKNKIVKIKVGKKNE